MDREKALREMELRKSRDSGITILTSDMKEQAGMNHQYVRDFSGGCSGLRKLEKKSEEQFKKKSKG